MSDRCDIKNLDLNPPLSITPYKVKEGVFVNVIDDGKILLGGSKLRALGKFIEENNDYDKFIYAGPSTGFAQVALTIACIKAHKIPVLFIQNTPHYIPRLTYWCQKLGAEINIFYDKLSEVENRAESYHLNNKQSFLIPFGLDFPAYNEILYEQLLEVIPSDFEPKRVWLTVGSGTLLRVLGKIWNNTEFYPVQVGKKMWEDQFEPELWKRMGGQKRIDLLQAPQKFFDEVPFKLLPPYSSVPNYDAKVWQQVLKFAKDGDYIWNVATLASTLSCDISIDKVFNLPTLKSIKNPEMYEIHSKDYLPANMNELSESDKYMAYVNAAKELIPLVRDGTIWFPFQKFYVEEPEILMENLKKVDLDIKHDNYRLYSYHPKNKFYIPYLDKNLKGAYLFRDKPTTMEGQRGHYLSADVISDYFIEDVRLKSKRYDQEYSVLECWELDDCITPILIKALENETITPRSLRDAIYDQVQETGTFMPSRAVGLLKLVLGDKLAGKKWLDISAGWGDRLLAAISQDMIYTGYDPNVDLKPGHSEMIRRLGNPKKQKVIYEPFEKGNIPDGPYDVVLTSPPFFNVENYATGQEGQSIVSYPDFDQWVVNFLFVALTKAWDNLKEGGYLILHFGDTKQLNVVEMTNIFIENYLPGASYEGVIGLAGGALVFRPVWCFKKLNRFDKLKRWTPNKPNRIPRTLYYYYPQIQKLLVQYYANKYINNTSVNDAKVVKDKLLLLYPYLSKEMNDLFIDNMLSSLIGSIGIENTIKWAVAMIKLALGV